MAKKNLEDCLVELFKTTISALHEKVRSGEATPQDIKNVIQLLKDNDITCDVKRPDNPLQGLLDDLPDMIGMQ